MFTFFATTIVVSQPSPRTFGASSGTDSPRHRPSTPSRIFQNLIEGGRSLSPFRSSSSSGFLSRAASLRSPSSDSIKRRSDSKREQLSSRDSAGKDVSVSARRPVSIASSSPVTGSAATTNLAQSSSSRSQLFSSQRSSDAISSSATNSPRILVKPPPPGEGQDQSPSLSTNGSGLPSETSTLSIEVDEELASTRSPSPFEDMTHSQVTASSENTINEDLPDSLRLMRVAQRAGIKVLDFAFEGPKREGVVEDWAWEGGQKCPGFGIGFGGGAYNGVLSKYRPPPKDTPPVETDDDEEDHRMVIDRPRPNIFSPRPASIIGTLCTKSFERESNKERSPLDPKMGVGSPPSWRTSAPISSNGFMQFLEERKQAGAAMLDHSGIKRERSLASAEPAQGEGSPTKKRSIG